MNKERQKEIKEVKESINEWIGEFDAEFVKERKKTYLIAEIDKTKKEFLETCQQISQREDDLLYWSTKKAEYLERKLMMLNRQVRIYQGKTINIDEIKIEQARNYPLADLVEHKHFMAKCNFHPDNNPSMSIKNNFYYCYSCNATGDVIDYVMKTKRLSFKEAINYLV